MAALLMEDAEAAHRTARRPTRAKAMSRVGLLGKLSSGGEDEDDVTGDVKFQFEEGRRE